MKFPLALLCALPLAAFAQTASEPQPGQRLFDGSCARCHGFDAAGAIGPNLQRSVLLRAENEPAFKVFVQNGSPDRGMPATPLADNEYAAIAAYVRSLRVVDTGVQSAQAARGKKVYEREQCGSCHIVQGVGRALGPELSSIGVTRKIEQLKQDLLQPAARLPQAPFGFTQYLPVRIVAKQGQDVSGVRLNEDAFSIQLRDADGRLHAFRKSEVAQLDKHYDKSVMPGVKLKAAQLDDLLAYLASLRGVK